MTRKQEQTIWRLEWYAKFHGASALSNTLTQDEINLHLAKRDAYLKAIELVTEEIKSTEERSA